MKKSHLPWSDFTAPWCKRALRCPSQIRHGHGSRWEGCSKLITAQIPSYSQAHGTREIFPLFALPNKFSAKAKPNFKFCKQQFPLDCVIYTPSIFFSLHWIQENRCVSTCTSVSWRCGFFNLPLANIWVWAFQPWVLTRVRAILACYYLYLGCRPLACCFYDRHFGEVE